jgi:iron(III) transport system substrate-binding protein
VTRPDIEVHYFVTGTTELDDVFRNNADQFDVVISSAMDLQLKLANDGFAARLDGISHPEWAQWRDSLFAFTIEPAAIVINNAAFADLPIPATRQDLIEVLRENSEKFMGKVGTYDVRQSGLGYLFATQDARVMSDNHLGRCRQPPWPVGLDGRRACPSGGQPHRPD